MTTLPCGNRPKCLSPVLRSDGFTPGLRRYQTTQHLVRRVGRIWWESHLNSALSEKVKSVHQPEHQ